MCTPLKWLHPKLNTPLLLTPLSELRLKTTLSTKKAGNVAAVMPTIAKNSSFTVREKKGKKTQEKNRPNPLHQ